MIKPADLESLSQFAPAPWLVTSCYLNVDPKRFTHATLEILLKDLSRERLSELKSSGLTHDQLKSVESDLERIHAYVSGHTHTDGSRKGLAAFACTGRDFFRTFGLRRGFRATLLVGPAPYLRPLSALLAQSTHACALLIDRRQARAFSIHGDEIGDLFDVTHDTPRSVREAGFQGKEEHRIERHHDEAVSQHYQSIADRLLQTFKSSQFEFLVLGGHLDEIRDFERHLHSWLAERTVGRFRIEVKASSPKEIIEKAAPLLRDADKSRQQDLVQRILGASRTNGGLAVTGLKNTLAALNDRRIQTLVAGDDLVLAGRRCPACETLFVADPRCTRCSGPTQEVADIVDEAIALTVHQGGTVRILSGETPLDAGGRIGAMLRY